MNVFLTQFPSISFGCAKSGAPIDYVRTEGLSVEGMECLTDLENLPNYAWHSSYHNFPNEVAKAQVKNPDLVRYANFMKMFGFFFFTVHCVCLSTYSCSTCAVACTRCEMMQVVDLRGLNSSTLNARTLEALKGVIAVNKCFPEVRTSEEFSFFNPSLVYL